MTAPPRAISAARNGPSGKLATASVAAISAAGEREGRGRGGARAASVCSKRNRRTGCDPRYWLIRSINSSDKCCNSIATGPEHPIVIVP